MTRPKVAFIFTHQIQYFTNVLDDLHRRGGIEMLVVYAHHTGKLHDAGFERVIEWDNRQDHTFPSVVLPDSAARQLGGFASSFSTGLFRELARFDPDVIHLNGYSAAIQWLGWIWALWHRKRLVVRGDGDTLGGGARGGKRLNMLLSRWFTGVADFVFHQGEENRKFWLARGARPERLGWIPCVPDNRVFRPRAFASDQDREAFRRSGGAKPGDVVFVVSGKLDARKRPADALAALARLGDCECKVWFLGSGPLEKELHALATSLGVADRVFWWGFRNQTELPRILQAGDVLLHLSEQDPWPYSVLEGAMSGLALLLSDRTGSYPDLVLEAGAGETFPCGDTAGLAERMRRFAKNPEVRNASRAAALRASEKYSETTFCEIFEATVARLAGPSNLGKQPAPGP